MKKLLLMTLALLALGATAALAQDSIDIEWGTACRIDNTTVAQNTQSSTIGGVPCNDPSDPMAANPTRTLTMQFTPSTALPDFSGTFVQVELTSEGVGPFAPGSIWDFQGACNPGAFDAKATVGTVTDCANPFAGDVNGQDNYRNVSVTPHKITYLNNRVRHSTTTAISAGMRYVADQVVLDFDSAAQTQNCPGCNQGVDFYLYFVEYFSPGTAIKALNPGIRPTRCVGWSNAPGYCGLLDPIKNSTWGKVKALYR